MDATEILSRMPVVGDVAAVTSALVTAVSVLLTEIRARRGNARAMSDAEIRDALLDLEWHLNRWSEDARSTNLAARELIETAGESEAAREARERAHRKLALTSFTQISTGKLTSQLLSQSSSGSLHQLLRIYAPDLIDLGDRFANRLNAVGDLEDLKSIGSRPTREQLVAAEARLNELERTRLALAEAADLVAAFIRTDFAADAPSAS
jgi:hypothetical protein